jgi:hypothetical protein
MAFKLEIAKRRDFLYCLVTGENSIETGKTYSSKILDACLQHRCTRVLLHEKLSGPRLKPLDMFEFVSHAAMKSLGKLDAVAYVEEERGELREFAEAIAKNRGMPLTVFSNVDDAERWLAALGECHEVLYGFTENHPVSGN